MAFTYTVQNQGTLGPQGMRMLWGTWTNTLESAGGEIETGMARVVAMILTPTSDYNMPYPRYAKTDGDGTVTITTGANVDGDWVAFGIGNG